MSSLARCDGLKPRSFTIRISPDLPDLSLGIIENTIGWSNIEQWNLVILGDPFCSSATHDGIPDSTIVGKSFASLDRRRKFIPLIYSIYRKFCSTVSTYFRKSLPAEILAPELAKMSSLSSYLCLESVIITMLLKNAIAWTSKWSTLIMQKPSMYLYPQLSCSRANQ